MGIESPTHIIFIAAVALIVLGPRRLPNLAKAVGRSVREFREALNDSSDPQENGVIQQEDPFSAYAADSAPPVPHVEVVEETAWRSGAGPEQNS